MRDLKAARMVCHSGAIPLLFAIATLVLQTSPVGSPSKVSGDCRESVYRDFDSIFTPSRRFRGRRYAPLGRYWSLRGGNSMVEEIPDTLKRYLIAKQDQVRMALRGKGIIHSPEELRDILKKHDVNVNPDEARIMWGIHNQVKFQNKRVDNKTETIPVEHPYEPDDLRGISQQVEKKIHEERSQIEEQWEEMRRKQEVDKGRDYNEVANEDFRYEGYEFTIVHIPHDDLLPLREIIVEVPSGTTPANDFLTEYLKRFVDRRPMDVDAIENAWGGFGRGMSNLPSMFESVGVEKLVLAGACDISGNKSVNMYIDETSALKRLPPNKRALQFVRDLHKSTESIQGDVYVGRIYNPMGELVTRRHLDFKLEDMRADSPFRKTAREVNIIEMRNRADLMKEMEKRGVQTFESGAGEQGKIPAREDEFQNMESCPEYKWRQNKREIEIDIPVPFDTRAKDCKIDFHPRVIRIKIYTEEDEDLSTIVLNLVSPIDSDTATWIIDEEKGRKFVTISLEKAQPQRWSVLEKSYKTANSFTWGQDDKHLQICHEIPREINSGRVRADIGNRNISAKYHTQPIFEFDYLEDEIIPEESKWEIVHNSSKMCDVLVFWLTKVKNSTWTKLGDEVNPELFKRFGHVAKGRKPQVDAQAGSGNISQVEGAADAPSEPEDIDPDLNLSKTDPSKLSMQELLAEVKDMKGLGNPDDPDD
ncbi:hypothetical protein AAMO2058_000658700 [Amorphochlora amoebiformis]